MTYELDKYLQEAAEKCEIYDNYYNGWHVTTNTSSPQHKANHLEEDVDICSDEENNKAIVPESQEKDVPPE